MKAFMIDREDVRQAMKTITSVTKEVVSGEIILSSQKERVQKMEIMSVLLKGEALKQQPKQSVRLFQ